MARDAQMLVRRVRQRPLSITYGVFPWPNMLFCYVIWNIVLPFSSWCNAWLYLVDGLSLVVTLFFFLLLSLSLLAIVHIQPLFILFLD